jgi:enoyl-CoA hydratase/carnithine racemase
VASPAARADWAAALGTPAVVVDLTGPAPVADTDALGAALRGVPAVLVGVGPPELEGPGAAATALFDVVVEDPAPVLATIGRQPVASVTLVLVLRAGSQLDVPSGLAVESAAYSVLQAGPEFREWRASRGRSTAAAEEPKHSTVLVERRGDVLDVTLNRPERHNAFNAAMRDSLAEAFLTALSDSSIERVVLRGAGPSFCSGGDLDEFGTLPDPATAHLTRLARSTGGMIALLAPRVEAHLHGACLGAGIELPAFAGRVVAHPDTVIALPEIGFGLIPGAGGTVSLPRRIGRQRTAELALSGARLDATTALGWGLVDEISSEDGLAVPSMDVGDTPEGPPMR